MNKKYKTALIISIIVGIFIVGGTVVAKYYLRKEPAVNTAGEKSVEPEQLTLCMLDGVSYKDKQKALRHPLAVIIENHPDARPQSGLIDASLVYEAITEGGITRYLAIYGPKDTKELGPIRSARLFFMDWLKEYDAFFAHAGGNEDALANIGSYQIKDLQHSKNYFWRDRKGRGVASEHTLYSSTDKLYEYATSKKFDTNSSSFEAMKFKASGPANQTGKGAEISFSSASYKVRWSYNPTENKYSRFLAGKEHKDLTTGKQITAENIIIQTVVRTLQPHGSYGSQNWVFTTTGSGKATILRDGEVITATWKKPARDSRTKFYTEAGVEIELNPGTTWYEIVPPEVSPSFI